ncbi:hypothetical protein D9M69_505270 [compost metagenome]
MLDQGLQSRLQEIRCEWFARFQQHRLVPVMTRGNLLRKEPLLDRRQQHRTYDRPLIDSQPLRALSHRRQCLHRLMLEQFLRRELDAHLSGTAHHLQRNDRVTTQLEEVIGQTDPLQLQHALPDRRDLPLQFRPRRHIGLLQLACIQLRQRPAVQLTIQRQRQFI